MTDALPRCYKSLYLHLLRSRPKPQVIRDRIITPQKLKIGSPDRLRTIKGVRFSACFFYKVQGVKFVNCQFDYCDLTCCHGLEMVDCEFKGAHVDLSSIAFRTANIHGGVFGSSSFAFDRCFMYNMCVNHTSVRMLKCNAERCEFANGRFIADRLLPRQKKGATKKEGKKWPEGTYFSGCSVSHMVVRLSNAFSAQPIPMKVLEDSYFADCNFTTIENGKKIWSSTVVIDNLSYTVIEFPHGYFYYRGGESSHEPQLAFPGLSMSAKKSVREKVARYAGEEGFALALKYLKMKKLQMV